MTQFYAVVDSAGALLSTYSSDALQQPDPDDLAARGLEIVAITHQLEADEMWDPASRAIVPRIPTPEEIAALEAQRAALGVEITEKQAILAARDGGKG